MSDRGGYIGSEAMITVCGVMADMGRDPCAKWAWDRVVWDAGKTVRAKWETMHEGRPVVRLMPKTRGKGTHDKAHYPESWRATIEAAVRYAEVKHGVVPAAAQVVMFGGDES